MQNGTVSWAEISAPLPTSRATPLASAVLKLRANESYVLTLLSGVKSKTASQIALAASMEECL